MEVFTDISEKETISLAEIVEGNTFSVFPRTYCGALFLKTDETRDGRIKVVNFLNGLTFHYLPNLRVLPVKAHVCVEE